MRNVNHNHITLLTFVKYIAKIFILYILLSSGNNYNPWEGKVMELFDELQGFVLTRKGNTKFKLKCPEWLHNPTDEPLVRAALNMYVCIESVTGNMREGFILIGADSCSTGMIASAIRESLRQVHAIADRLNIDTARPAMLVVVH